jgi:hypothetical protein
MATYLELRSLYGHGDLLNRIEVACIVSAETIRTEADSVTNHANRLKWAKATYGSSRAAAEKMLMSLLAANKALTSAQLISVTDAALQTAVDSAVNIFADGT